MVHGGEAQDLSFYDVSASRWGWVINSRIYVRRSVNDTPPRSHPHQKTILIGTRRVRESSGITVEETSGKPIYGLLAADGGRDKRERAIKGNYEGSEENGKTTQICIVSTGVTPTITRSRHEGGHKLHLISATRFARLSIRRRGLLPSDPELGSLCHIRPFAFSLSRTHSADAPVSYSCQEAAVVSPRAQDTFFIFHF
jgi:hypothetical protein